MANSLVWFRKGLRLHDNEALIAAAKGASKLYPGELSCRRGTAEVQLAQVWRGMSLL